MKWTKMEEGMKMKVVNDSGRILPRMSPDTAPFAEICRKLLAQVFVTAHYPLRSHELAQLSEIVLGLFPPEREADGEDRFHGLCTIL